MLLRPVASLLLKCGMTWKEFASVSKSVFVQAATEEYGIRGRPTNVSRVSILTGISRKEVKRQRELLQRPDTSVTTKTTDATRLLSGWHQDPDYQDADGQPLVLAMTGAEPNFASLFAAYGGDTPQQTLIKELRSAHSIVLDANGCLIAKTRYHMPVAMTDGNIRFFGTSLYDHAHTLNNNVAGGADTTRRFERFAADDQIDPASVAAFKAFVDSRGQQFLEEVDAWLRQHRIDDTKENSHSVRLGIGLYAIDGQLPGVKPQ